MTTRRTDILDSMAIGLACGMFIYIAGFFAFAEFRHVLGHLADDASYYFRIAENVAAGHGPTFDGVHGTSGYQPLWLLALVPVSLLFQAAPETMVRIYLLYQTVMLGVAGWLLWRVHSGFFTGRTLVFNSILAAYLVFYSFTNGMDSGILILMLSVLYYSGYRLRIFERRLRARTLLFGILLGLSMLARLDTVFLGMSICAFFLFRAMALRGERWLWLERIGLVVLGSAIVCIPYLAVNAYYFGDPIPISATLKSSFPRLTLDMSTLGRRPLAFALMALIYLVWAVALRNRAHAAHGYYRSCVAILSAAVVLHAVHTVLFMKWAVFDWHFAPYSLLAVLVVSEPVAYLTEKSGGTGRRWIVATAILLSFGVGHRTVSKTLLASREDAWRERGYEAAIWARENTQPSDLFAMKDSGHFAYFSQRAVISLDGVVNTLAFQRVLNEGQLRRYLKASGVKYLAQHVILDGDPTFSHRVSWEGEGDERDYRAIACRYRSQLHDSYSDELTIDRDSEVYRGRPYREKRKVLPFLIWDLSDGVALDGD